MVKLLVDGREIEAQEGTVLLQACLGKGIYIPNLCFLEDMGSPPASCRLCFVQIEGREDPVPSCAVKVTEPMVVKTDTPAVRSLQRSAFRFLMSVHEIRCRPCPANRKCELQRIAKFLQIGLNPKGLETSLKETSLVQNHPLLDYHPNRCVLCGRCIHVCQRQHGRALMTFAKRGFDTVVSFYGNRDPAASPCRDCLACVETCPVAAITLRQSSPNTHAL